MRKREYDITDEHPLTASEPEAFYGEVDTVVAPQYDMSEATPMPHIRSLHEVEARCMSIAQFCDRLRTTVDQFYGAKA